MRDVNTHYSTIDKRTGETVIKKRPYPVVLFEYFLQMEIGESVKRDDLIKLIWRKEPDWFNRRSFDVAKVSSIKGTGIELQIRKGIITKLK